MRPRYALLTLAACLMLCWLWAGQATAAGQDSLRQGIKLYERAEFEEAQRLLLEAINSGYLDSTSLARAYAYLGLIYLANDQDTYAEDVFARAKGQDPSFRPDPALFSPSAIELFQKAKPQGHPVRPLSTPAPAAQSTSPPVPSAQTAPPAAPAVPTPLPRAAEPVQPPTPAAKAYVIEVNREDIAIDQGSGQGVHPGDRFEIIEERTIVHPVTGQQLHSRRQVATVMAVEVQAALSLCKFVSGRLELVTPGLEAHHLNAPQARPAAPVSRRRAGAETRIMVLPPELNISSSDPYVDRQVFKADEVARALNTFARIDAFAADPAALAGLDRHRPSSLAGIMERTEADSVLVWSVSSRENEVNHLTLRYSLYLRGNDQPIVQEKEMASGVKMQRQYGTFIAETIADELKLAK